MQTFKQGTNVHRPFIKETLCILSHSEIPNGGNLYAWPNHCPCITCFLFFTLGFLIQKGYAYICSELWVEQYDYCYLRDNRALKHNDDGKILYISSIGVDPSHRGAGVGRSIARALLKKMYLDHGASKAVGVVGTTWVAARRMWKSVGFVEREIVPDFFGAKADGVAIEVTVDDLRSSLDL
jgi:ribosomal protein S18 acetylase RimI-like enzyme